MLEQIPDNKQESLNQWFSYLADFWLNRIGPTRFSVYRAVNRTNNFSESGHRAINEFMNGNHLNYFEFHGKINKRKEIYVLCNIFNVFVFHS